MAKVFSGRFTAKNMPRFGPGAAVEQVQATGQRETARLRLNANQSS